MNTDRNLLFGVLALQMDFISRDALIAAMHSWVVDKRRTLGELLLQQQALEPVRYALLEALVQEHLRLHDDDPALSLAALKVPGSVRADLQQLGDQEVDATLSRTAPELAAQDPLTTREPSTSQAPADSLRFRILRPHAKGGLGEVYVAEDAELHREVALKEIQEAHADDAVSRARFLLEAEITGGLEHPGVVPVYGLGQYADGRPFYAMRFIRGDNLQRASERFHGIGRGRDVPARPDFNGSEFRQLLGRFQDICNAVAYAHSRGVLHRDLKPGNIMLGQFGETLVVDWGLAKLVGAVAGLSTQEPAERPLRPHSATSGATLEGSAVGTPSYMSPEQAAGRLDHLGPASDVYSLGAILYCVLTGRAAFASKDVGEVLHQVQQGDFPPPRAIQPALPPALEAICLRAMALQPAQRYPDPKTLADDLDHWLADEPVTAYREPWRDRTRRWMRRHRTLVTGLAAAVLVALPCLIVATVLLSSANDQLTQANVREREARTRAQEQKQLADNNYRLARKGIDEYLTRISQDLRLMDHDLEGLRKDLLQEAAKYYEEFVRQRSDDPDVLAEQARAYDRLAYITSLTGTREESEAAYLKARTVCERLVAEHPDHLGYQAGLAATLEDLGTCQIEAGQFAKAEAVQREALNIRKRLLDAQPQNAVNKSYLALLQSNLGVLYHKQGQLDRAGPHYEEGLRLHREVVQQHPDEALYLGRLAEGLNNASFYYGLRRQAGRRKAALNEARTILEQLVSRQSHDPRWPNELAEIHLQLAYAHNNDDVHSAALKEFQAALALQEALTKKHPTVTRFQRTLADIHNGLGIVARKEGRMADAERAYLQALAIRERLAREHGSVTDYLVALGGSYSNMGYFMWINHRHEESLPWFAKAIDTLEKALKVEPKDLTARLFLYKTLTSRAVVLDGGLGRPTDALRDLERAFEFAPADERAWLQVKKAQATARLGDHARAAGLVEQVVAEGSKLPAEEVAIAGWALALAAIAIAKDKDVPVAERERLAEQYACRAVELLRRARDLNHFKATGNVKELQTSTDLEALRQRPDFLTLLKEVEMK